METARRREGLQTECDSCPAFFRLKKAAVRMRITLELTENGRFRAKSSPTCFGAFGRERVFWLPQGRVKLSLQPRDDSNSW